MPTNKRLSLDEQKALLSIMNERFQSNLHRHEGLKWETIQERLKNHQEKLWTLQQMELTGGEPDVIGYDGQTDEYIFCDCAKESPKGRRSLCYDREALHARKKNKPESSAVDVANEMGVDLLTEEQYFALQAFEPFDQKTSNWILAPENVRKRGGALFCDFRYGRVFVYHNGATSYYSSRGFRGMIRV